MVWHLWLAFDGVGTIPLLVGVVMTLSFQRSSVSCMVILLPLMLGASVPVVEQHHLVLDVSTFYHCRWWWHHILTAHQHQKGHTVPKQVIMIATSIQVATV